MNRWQRSITQKAIRANKVDGFDCGYIATPTKAPTPVWKVKFLGVHKNGKNGTQEFFTNIKDAQQWIREWGEI